MSGTLREDLSVFRIFGGDICRAIINTTHCCVARVLIFIILLTATYVQQTGNAMFQVVSVCVWSAVVVERLLINW